MNDNLRMLLGIILAVVALFFSDGDVDNPFSPTPPKLEKPEAEIVELVDDLPSIDKKDSSKLSGVFNAMYEGFDKVEVNNNLQLQYFIDAVGKESTGQEMKGKYTALKNAISSKLVLVAGPQTESGNFKPEERNKLARLFYGLSWKLYEKDHDDLFEEYKAKAMTAVKKFINDEDEDDVTPDVEDCPCEGKGYIVHGDGHRTECPCVASGECNCAVKCGSVGEKPTTKVEKPNGHKCGCDKPGQTCGCFAKYGKCDCPPVVTQKKATVSKPVVKKQYRGYIINGNCPDGRCPTVKKKYNGLPLVPRITRYNPIVRVRGMSVTYHLMNGAPGEHNPVPAYVVNSLNTAQKYWLHDYLHGYNRG